MRTSGEFEDTVTSECVPELKLLTATAQLPTMAHATDSGWDIYADISRGLSDGTEDTEPWIQVPPGDSRLVPTGVAIQAPPGYWYDLRGRSSTFFKHKLITIPGVIDAGYVGELHAVLYNPGPQPARVVHGQKVAQLVWHRVVKVHYQRVEHFTPSERGTKGWGSSG